MLWLLLFPADLAVTIVFNDFFASGGPGVTEPVRQLFYGMNLGIRSGPLVAGVIGQSKFHYDVYGDTVNTASGMKSQGQPGAEAVRTRRCANAGGTGTNGVAGKWIFPSS